jgi:ParB/RepB/Spo0J family partition protein
VRPAKPSPHLTGGTFYEIVAGERRFRAAKRAGLTHVPAVVRQLTDLQVLEAQLIENGQRDDIHPIEAADTFAALQKLDGSCNAKVIATKIGKSERYVQNVLHYAVLVPKAKQAFLEDHINAGHADLIARLKPADQERALKACFDNLYGDDEERGAISVRSLDRWIKENVRLDPVADAPQLPELQKLVDAKKGDAAAALSTILQVSGSYSVTPATKGLMGPNDYRVVQGKKDVCGHMRRALLVIGDDRGKLIDICTARTSCKVHWKYEVERLERERKPATQAAGESKASSAMQQKRERAARVRAQQKEQELEQLRQRKLKVWSHVLAKVAPKVIPNKPTPALLALFGIWAKRPPTWRDVAIEELRNVGGYRLVGKDAPRIAKLLRPLGIDLVAIERELFPPAPTKGVTDPKELKGIKKQIDRRHRKAGAKK